MRDTEVSTITMELNFIDTDGDNKKDKVEYRRNNGNTHYLEYDEFQTIHHSDFM